MIAVWTQVGAGQFGKSLEKWIDKDSLYRGGLSIIFLFLKCLAVWSQESTQQNWCWCFAPFRVVMGSLMVARFFASLDGMRPSNFSSPMACIVDVD